MDRSIQPLEKKYMEEEVAQSNGSLKLAQDFTVRKEYKPHESLRIQMSASKPMDNANRKPVLPGKSTPKMGGPDNFQRKSSLPDRAKLKSSLQETYKAAQKPKVMMVEMDDSMDPDSLAATLLKDEAKRKEKEILAEKKKVEAEERKRQKEIKQR